MRNGEIKHAFYLGQKVKTFYKNREFFGRVVEIKVRTKGSPSEQRQVLDDKAMVSYRIEGILGNVLEVNLQSDET